MKRVAQLLMIISLCYCSAAYAAGNSDADSFMPVPEKGFVPDAQTAISIAEAVWIPIYGESKIKGEAPFKATLSGDTWTVWGSLPPGVLGGTAVAKISRTDGRILGITHEK
jgi:hypothetical protein